MARFLRNCGSQFLFLGYHATRIGGLIPEESRFTIPILGESYHLYISSPLRRKWAHFGRPTTIGISIKTLSNKSEGNSGANLALGSGCASAHFNCTSLCEAGPPRPARLWHVRRSLHSSLRIRKCVSRTCTEMGERVGPRLRELASRGRREPGGGIHAT